MSNKPIWIWVDEKLPNAGDVVKATDGYYVEDAYITLKGEWSYIHDDAGPVIAWLYEPQKMQPPPPTLSDYEEYQMQLAWQCIG